jgi:hypothetical protein
MTGYNMAHGDTNAVQLDLNNDEFAYRGYMAIIRRIVWWDDNDGTWNDIDKAANAVRAFAGELTGDDNGAYGEIRDADFDAVNWQEIVTDVLQEENLQEGRERDAGLSRYL